MTKPISIGAMLTRLSGLIDTKDVSDWENKFLQSVWTSSRGGTHTSHLTGKQVERVEQIFEKHFAG